MALELSTEMRRLLPQLRFGPTARRIRADVGSRTIVDSERAVLVWEARRTKPVYAVPDADIAAELVPCPAGSPTDPPTGFRRHTGPGEEFTVVFDGTELAGAAFRPADHDLSGYVLLDHAAFDQWREEEQVVEG